MHGQSRDPLDGDWNPSAYWSTTNVGEAMPGVLTPLCWALWGPACERAVRSAFRDIGVLERRRADLPEVDQDRMIGIFRGRVAASVDFLGEMGDRLPGTSGAAVAEQLLGQLPDNFRSQPTNRRLPVVAMRMPIAMATIAPRLRRLQRATDAWWRSELVGNPTYDLGQARAQWERAVRWFGRAMSLQALSVFVAVQPAYDQVLKAAARAGRGELGARVLAGQGSHVELDLVEDLWRVSRADLSLDQFLNRYGYHGPGEGELSSTVWREDPSPLHTLVAQYRTRPDSERPSVAHRQRAEGRAAATRELVDGLSGVERRRARVALALADRFVPLRGVGKVAFLQSIDVARAAARRIGHHLSQQGVLRHPDDVFYLSSEELLTAGPGRSLDSVVASRRARRAEHQQVELPKAWRARPVPIMTGDRPPAPGSEPSAGATVLRAIGASPGVAEGPVRVVTDPTGVEIQEGDILVATTTDPGWASIMFLSAALVVDLGGLLSHAAVVARELGIPCVMATDNGTELLQTGDIVRVDGNAGTVEVLQRSGAPA